MNKVSICDYVCLTNSQPPGIVRLQSYLNVFLDHLTLGFSVTFQIALFGAHQMEFSIQTHRAFVEHDMLKI